MECDTTSGDGTGRTNRLVALLLLVPVATGLWMAARISLVAVPLGASGEDALLTRLAGPEETEGRHRDALERAARSGSLDFRYPYWQGLAIWFDRSGDLPASQRALRAREWFLTAAGRAKSLAEPRYYLHQTAASMGRAEEADRQAEAVLELAPLRRGLARKIQRWFGIRYRQTRSDAHLAACLRAGEPGDDFTVALLSQPLLTFEETRRILELSELPPTDRVELLARADRWDWALRLVTESGDPGVSSLEAALRGRYGSYLLGAGRPGLAREELESTLEAAPADFDRWLDLGIARRLTGEPEGGLAALAAALGADSTAADVAEALRRSGVDPSDQVSFWTGRVREEGPRKEWALEEARARLASGDKVGAERLLRDLLDASATGAEANWLLATILVEAGNPGMARPYAERAVELSPDSRKFRKLVERLSGEKR